MSSFRGRFFYLLIKHVLSNILRHKAIKEQRRRFDRFGGKERLPAGVHLEKIVLRGMAAEWLTPTELAGGEVILYFHGGAYVMGSCAAYRAMAARIALATRRRVLLFEYRLAPENPFPDALEDAVWIFGWLQKSGIPFSKIAFMGDSSGGGLALATGVYLRDQGMPLPRTIVCISPWIDLSLSLESTRSKCRQEAVLEMETLREAAGQYAGKNHPRLPLISPLYADLAGFPPLLIQVGEYEVLHDEAVRLEEHARQAGVPVTLNVFQGMWHVWHYFAKYVPEGRLALEEIGLYLEKIFSNKAGTP